MIPSEGSGRRPSQTKAEGSTPKTNIAMAFLLAAMGKMNKALRGLVGRESAIWQNLMTRLVQHDSHLLGLRIDLDPELATKASFSRSVEANQISDDKTI